LELNKNLEMLLQRGPNLDINRVLKAPGHLDGKPPLSLAPYLLDQYEAFMRVLFTEALLAVDTPALEGLSRRLSMHFI
jgi:hypothetical protein